MDMKWWNLVGLALSILIYKEWGVSFSLCLVFAIIVGLFTVQLLKIHISKNLFGGGKMATLDRECYWRIYILLHEGTSLISKQVISREVEKFADDIDNLLLKNKQKLDKIVSTAEADVLFPKGKGTDIEQWETNLFPRVILTLFSGTVPPTESQHIRDIQHLQTEIENLHEQSLDTLTYDNFAECLSEALTGLAGKLSTDTQNKISEFVKIYIKKPFNAAEIATNITKLNLPNEIQHNLWVFLETSMSGSNETAGVDAYETSPNDSLNGRKEITSDDVCEWAEDAKPLSEFDKLDHVELGSDAVSVQKVGHGHTEDRVKSFHLQEADIEKCKKTNDIDDSAIDKAEKSEDQQVVNVAVLEQTVTDEICRGSDDGAISALGSDMLVQNVGHGLTEDDVKSFQWQYADIEKCIKTNDFGDSAKDKVENWEDQQVKVAVLGRTGTGKSRFINAIRDIRSKTDPLYAKIGSIETTSTVESFAHPKNSNLHFYDIPGIGTKNFPRNTYMEDDRIKFDSYDIYLVIASDRFTEDDTIIAEALEKLSKVFLFVRTKVDTCLEDLDNVDEVKCEIEEIRADCKKNLKDLRLKSNDVYLISSKYVDHPFLDFGKLVQRLVDGLSGLKKEVLIFALQSKTHKFIEDKKEHLLKRALKAGAKSAVGGAIPIPGVSFTVDVRLICNELKFYRETLGITEDDLRNLAKKTNKNVDELRREYKLKTFDFVKLTTKELAKTGMQLGPIFARIAMSEAVETSLKLIPVIGSAAAAACSSITTVMFLRSNINLMVEDALTMMDIRIKETRWQCLE